jgi:cellulose synthase/poly-beta-1,6-N-acetylglucosamine synthase-like glycosyltransferase
MQCRTIYPGAILSSSHIQQQQQWYFIGEDRWLSCLLLKAGWLLDYCSLAEVSTVCPETFDDFFQQRRHWIMTSFANTCWLIKDFWNIRHFNYKLSVFYFAYLIATVFFVVVR